MSGLEHIHSLLVTFNLNLDAGDTPILKEIQSTRQVSNVQYMMPINAVIKNNFIAVVAKRIYSEIEIVKTASVGVKGKFAVIIYNLNKTNSTAPLVAFKVIQLKDLINKDSKIDIEDLQVDFYQRYTDVLNLLVAPGQTTPSFFNTNNLILSKVPG